ncbi:hypothetical protein HZH66_011084 [Vespula vulgaris]|uniref:Uncharacterized protein n=1 Tax=Vespula vulgaris TaxID=7454 RepID=A0A834JEZ2_VESVU|nr:hypothetical protein HZH66_011084 [Vespula vulgaris]
MAALNSKRACRVYFPPSTCRNDAWPRKTTGLSGWNRLANIPDDDDDDDEDEDDDYGVEDDDYDDYDHDYDDYDDYDDATTILRQEPNSRRYHCESGIALARSTVAVEKPLTTCAYI